MINVEPSPQNGLIPSAPPLEQVDPNKENDAQEVIETDSEEENWAYKAGRAVGVKPSRPPPPLIDLDKIGASKGHTFPSQKDDI